MTIASKYSSISPRGRMYMPPVVGSAYDADAQAFIDAVGSLTTAQQDAVNDLVVAMKTAGVWSKGITYYPMVGGTATAHKWNLFNPLNTDAAFRGTFAGGWTHNANGAQGNGTNGYMDTHVVPASHITQNDHAIIYVSGTSTASNTTEIGMDMGYGNGRMAFTLRGWTTSHYIDSYNQSTGRISGANSDASGVHIESRTGAAVQKYFRNGSQVGSTNTGSPSPGSGYASLTRSMYLNALHFTIPAYYSPKLCKGAGIFDGLNDTEIGDLTTAIDDFNTALGR